MSLAFFDGFNWEDAAVQRQMPRHGSCNSGSLRIVGEMLAVVHGLPA